MRGSIRTQHGGTQLYAVIDETDPKTGKRKRRWFNLHTTSRRKAETELAKIIGQQTQGTLPPAGKTTVADILQTYIDSRRVAGRAPRTIERYVEQADGHIIPALGKHKAADLRPADIERFYASKLADGLSPTTVYRMHALLRAAFRHAVKQSTVTRNPIDATTPPTPASPEQKAMRDEQAELLLRAAEGHRLHPLLVIALTTGMRAGELAGVRWNDIDLDTGLMMVRVQRQYLRKVGIVQRKTKAYRRDRPVELSEAEVALLRAHKARQAEERLRIGDMWRDHGLVFPSEVGTPLSTGNLRRWFYATLEKAGLPHFRFHDLRHTAATFLLKADPRINVAQQRLGHRDPAITARFYAHVLPGEQGKAAAVVANRLLGSDAGAPEGKRQTKR